MTMKLWTLPCPNLDLGFLTVVLNFFIGAFGWIKYAATFALTAILCANSPAWVVKGKATSWNESTTKKCNFYVRVQMESQGKVATCQQQGANTQCVNQ